MASIRRTATRANKRHDHDRSSAGTRNPAAILAATAKKMIATTYWDLLPRMRRRIPPRDAIRAEIKRNKRLERERIPEEQRQWAEKRLAEADQ